MNCTAFSVKYDVSNSSASNFYLVKHQFNKIEFQVFKNLRFDCLKFFHREYFNHLVRNETDLLI